MVNSHKELLYSLIEKNELSKAYSYVNQHIQENQAEESFVIFYILLQIWKEECQANMPTFFSSPDIGRYPHKLLEHYTQIKLYLRRFEYQLPDDIRQEAFEYFTTYQVSPYALYRIAQFACIQPASAFEGLAQFYRNAGNQEFADIFQRTATQELTD